MKVVRVLPYFEMITSVFVKNLVEVEGEFFAVICELYWLLCFDLSLVLFILFLVYGFFVVVTSVAKTGLPSEVLRSKDN